ncbi:unnamed protein product [Didymodactylos carnosus]|nr:unnamed protein product [Didymodactylos carnosus]CAF3857423.1 unnamed protein product [Didymodactylos carnosus]
MSVVDDITTMSVSQTIINDDNRANESGNYNNLNSNNNINNGSTELAYLPIGCSVSAKYRGAFCEAIVKTVDKQVKVKVSICDSGEQMSINEEQIIAGTLKIGNTVTVKIAGTNRRTSNDSNSSNHNHRTNTSHYGEEKQAVIKQINDNSLYTVVFDDGDEKSLRRSSLCVQGIRLYSSQQTTHHQKKVLSEIPEATVTSSAVPSASLSTDSLITTSKPIQPESIVAVRRKPITTATGTQSQQICFPGLILKRKALADYVWIKSFLNGREYVIARDEIHTYHNNSDIQNLIRSTSKQAFIACEKYLKQGIIPKIWTDKKNLTRNDEQTLMNNLSDDDEIDSESEEDFNDSQSDDETVEEKDSFVAQLFAFMDDRGTPINNIPKVSNCDLDLHRLFKVVRSMGGYNKVTKNEKWRRVHIKMGLSLSSANNGHVIENAYKKYLLSYEEILKKLGSMNGQNTYMGESRRSLMRVRVQEKPAPIKKRARKSSTATNDSSSASHRNRGSESTEKGSPSPGINVSSKKKKQRISHSDNDRNEDSDVDKPSKTKKKTIRRKTKLKLTSSSSSASSSHSDSSSDRSHESQETKRRYNKKKKILNHGMTPKQQELISRDVFIKSATGVKKMTKILKPVTEKIITKPTDEITKKLNILPVKSQTVHNESIKPKLKDNIQIKDEPHTKVERKVLDVATTSKKISIPTNTNNKNEKGAVNNQKLSGKTATTSSVNVTKQKISVDQNERFKKQQHQLTSSSKQQQPSKSISEHSKTSSHVVVKQENTNNKISLPTKLTVPKNKLTIEKNNNTDGSLSKASAASRPVSTSSSDHVITKHSSEQQKIPKNISSSVKIQQHQNRSNINQSSSSKKVKSSSTNSDNSKKDTKASLLKDQKVSTTPVIKTNQSSDEFKHKVSNMTDVKLSSSTGVADKKKNEKDKILNAQQRLVKINPQEKIKTSSNANASKIKPVINSQKKIEKHKTWNKESIRKSRTTSTSSASDIEPAKVSDNLSSQGKIFRSKNQNSNQLKQVHDTESIQIKPTSPSPSVSQEQQLGAPTLTLNTNFHYHDEQMNENSRQHHVPFSTNMSYTTGTVLIPTPTMTVTHPSAKPYPTDDHIHQTIPNPLLSPSTATSDYPPSINSHVDAYTFDENEDNGEVQESKKRRYNSAENTSNSPDLLYVSSFSNCQDENIGIISKLSADDQHQPPAKRLRRSLSSQESGETLSSTSSVHKHSLNRSEKPSPNKHEYLSNYTDATTNASSNILDMNDINRSGGMSFNDIKVNDILSVYWGINSNGKPYVAKCMEKNEKTGKLFVHYNGWNSRYDEWISPNQVVELCDQSVWPIRRRRTSQVYTPNTRRQSFVDSPSSSITSTIVDISSSSAIPVTVVMDEKQLDIQNDITKLDSIEQHEEQLECFHSLEETTKEKTINPSQSVISLLSTQISSISSASYKPEEEDDDDEDRFSDVSSIINPSIVTRRITESNTSISDQKLLVHDLPNNELEESNLCQIEQKQSYKDEIRRRTISNDIYRNMIETNECEDDGDEEDEKQQHDLSLLKEAKNNISPSTSKKNDHDQRQESSVQATVITTSIKNEPIVKEEQDYDNNLLKPFTHMET